MSVNGLVTSVAWVPQGSELTAPAIIGATTLYVESTVDFDDAGGDLEINGDRYEYDSCDEDADTITLTTGLVAAVAEDDRVLVVSGGQTAIEYVAFVTMGEGDDAEVEIPYAQRPLWPEGVYEEPVPVVLSDDLETIVAVPARTPVIDSTTYQTSGDGERIVIRNDGSAGIIEFFSGVADETNPGKVNPSAVAGWPGIEMVAGGTLSSTRFARVAVRSGDTTADPSTGEIVADEVTIADHNGNHYLQLTKAAGFVFASALDFDFLLGVINATMGDGSVGTGTFRTSVDARVTDRTQTGLVASATIPADPVNWTNLGTFAFPTAFTAAPNVIVQSQTSYGADWIALRTTATTTNFTLYGKSPTAKGAQTVAWIAVSNG